MLLFIFARRIDLARYSIKTAIKSKPLTFQCCNGVRIDLGVLKLFFFYFFATIIKISNNILVLNGSLYFKNSNPQSNMENRCPSLHFPTLKYSYFLAIKSTCRFTACGDNPIAWNVWYLELLAQRFKTIPNHKPVINKTYYNRVSSVFKKISILSNDPIFKPVSPGKKRYCSIVRNVKFTGGKVFLNFCRRGIVAPSSLVFVHIISKRMLYHMYQSNLRFIKSIMNGF
ncbi:hypothetical protein BDA99DRAFT_543031 [Phascolomyces articulosus]|uniref:Uncharacterized protein n=1 Tax=Phascolomyces articulosus TaxID=60185 RepID=A0AAD5JYY0_9FUNG|nr:hypothetical protein BDA99DRAFT_543031 [Phascolomyces articulosus]